MTITINMNFNVVAGLGFQSAWLVDSHASVDSRVSAGYRNGKHCAVSAVYLLAISVIFTDPVWRRRLNVTLHVHNLRWEDFSPSGLQLQFCLRHI